VATFPGHSDHVEGLIEKADIALYACKEGGRNCYRLYDPVMKKETK